MSQPVLISRLTCPHCGHAEELTMPTDMCQFFHQCVGCNVVLKPGPGDCCVFCSSGTVPCPPIQDGAGCCGVDS
ncbi:MAG: GDCCVxC domain-containing (seleno)protein [Pseudomonadota bacterium]|nr:GDCCVxC domain-containing (seleno)protein [Pseudomonadota bacterium]